MNARISHCVFLTLVFLISSETLEAQFLQELFDLRPGVERIYDKCSNSPIAYCPLGETQYVHEVVIGITLKLGEPYSMLVRRNYENGFPSQITDTLYLTAHDGRLVQFEDEQARLLVDLIRPFNSFIDDLDVVILADTTAVFPDGETYRVVLASSWHESPINNSNLHTTILTDNLAAVSGYGEIDGWLLPFKELPFMHETFFYVDRFGYIFSNSKIHPGVLVSFRSHLGQWFGVNPNKFPLSTDIPEVPDVPIGFSLEQNYPNPFNPSTVISFKLPVVGEVQVAVYDVLGRKVATLVNGTMSAGSHQITFEAGSLSSGVYVIRMQAGDFVDSRQIVLVK